jgi:4-hydroxythreonine-4-phosphate dehydrogenase
MGKAGGLTISGPLPPDTVYLRASRGAWDVVLAAHHDQGLIPVKILDFERSVNVTIGLPYLRCSVDHGTAFDIAGRGIADPAPMKYAIEWAAHHAETGHE